MSNPLVFLMSTWVLDPFHLDDGVAWNVVILFYVAQGLVVVYSCGDRDEGD